METLEKFRVFVVLQADGTGQLVSQFLEGLLSYTGSLSHCGVSLGSQGWEAVQSSNTAYSVLQHFLIANLHCNFSGCRQNCTTYSGSSR